MYLSKDTYEQYISLDRKFQWERFLCGGQKWEHHLIAVFYQSYSSCYTLIPYQIVDVRGHPGYRYDKQIYTTQILFLDVL